MQPAGPGTIGNASQHWAPRRSIKWVLQIYTVSLDFSYLTTFYFVKVSVAPTHTATYCTVL